MPAGLAYDLRTCGRCGMMYDHEGADWHETLCGDCR